MNAETSRPAKTGNRMSRLILLLTLSGLAGGVIAFSVFYMLFSGFLTRWRPLEPAPPESAKIVAGWSGQVYIETETGQVFSCSLGTPECWIQDVVPADALPTLPCEGNEAAFSWRANPPKEMDSCIHVEEDFAEAGYEIYYALDRQGVVWKWETVHSAYAVLVMPVAVLAGCLAGLLLGSLVWIGLWWVRRRGTQKRLSSIQIALLAIPWVCLVGAALLWVYSTADRSPLTEAEQRTWQTETAASERAKSTEEALVWQSLATPSPQNPVYDLTANICAETWQLWPEGQACPGDPTGPGAYVALIKDANLEGTPLSGPAIVVGMTAETEQFYKEYATMEIPAGARFKAQAGCLDGSTGCDLVFRLAIRRQNVPYTTLGQWRQTYDGKIEQIDLDLADFTGEQVRLILTVYPYHEEASVEQAAAWLYPRVEAGR